MAVLKMNVLSKCLGMQTNITICLPSFSHKDVLKPDFYVPGMKFQTLYLLHGGSGDDADFINFTNIICYADEHRIAVVMPCGYNHFYTDDPNGPKYWKFVSEELPEICQTLFPLSDKREDNFVGGHTMGAHGAMKLGILKCENFAAVLCMSGVSLHPNELKEIIRLRANIDSTDPDIMPRVRLDSIFGDVDHFRGSIHDVNYYAALNVEQGKILPKFFLTSGEEDISREYIEETHHYLSSLGYDVFIELVPGRCHDWSFWDLTLKKALDNWLPIKHDVLYP
jgi:putative tributyrin esterase